MSWGFCDFSEGGFQDCNSFAEAVGSLGLAFGLGLLVALVGMTLWRLVRLAWSPVVTKHSLGQDLRESLHSSRRLREDVIETSRGGVPSKYAPIAPRDEC